MTWEDYEDFNTWKYLRNPAQSPNQEEWQRKALKAEDEGVKFGKTLNPRTRKRAVLGLLKEWNPGMEEVGKDSTPSSQRSLSSGRSDRDSMEEVEGPLNRKRPRTKMKHSRSPAKSASPNKFLEKKR